MDKKEIASFFDSLAGSWDGDMIKSQWKIDRILSIAEVTAGKSVLDVACGTGVLVPDYISRNVRKYVGIDISKNMIEIAKNKFSAYESFDFICGDAEIYDFSVNFDCIVVYNAFPHFANRTLLFENLSAHINDSGRITIAHGMSRDDLIRHHSGRAESVSTVLPDTSEMKEIMQPYFNIDTCISDDDMYIISGTTLR